MQHCDRPWWKRPPTWFIAIAVLALIGVLARLRHLLRKRYGIDHVTL
jgi:hypothetical protein